MRLAFDTIEKIVREHFGHITETEATTFTDAVNCLVAFTNNPHSLEVRAAGFWVLGVWGAPPSNPLTHQKTPATLPQTPQQVALNSNRLAEPAWASRLAEGGNDGR